MRQTRYQGEQLDTIEAIVDDAAEDVEGASTQLIKVPLSLSGLDAMVAVGAQYLLLCSAVRCVEYVLLRSAVRCVKQQTISVSQSFAIVILWPCVARRNRSDVCCGRQQSTRGSRDGGSFAAES